MNTNNTGWRVRSSAHTFQLQEMDFCRLSEIYLISAYKRLIQLQKKLRKQEEYLAGDLRLGDGDLQWESKSKFNQYLYWVIGWWVTPHVTTNADDCGAKFNRSGTARTSRTCPAQRAKRTSNNENEKKNPFLEVVMQVPQTGLQGRMACRLTAT